MASSSHTTATSSGSIKSLISSTHGAISPQTTSTQRTSSSSETRKHKTSLSIHTVVSDEPILGAVSTTPILDSADASTPADAPKLNDTAKPEDTSSWRDKFHIHSKPEVPGKEKWRDASLSEKERWKGWQKAKDKEQARGGAVGFYTQFYKAPGVGKLGYWLAL
jgi:hypothetical protein